MTTLGQHSVVINGEMMIDELVHEKDKRGKDENKQKGKLIGSIKVPIQIQCIRSFIHSTHFNLLFAR